MKKISSVLILFLLIFKTSLASTYSTDPQMFVQELVNDAINKLSDKNLTEKEKLEVNILSSLTGIKNPSPPEEDKQPSTPPPHKSRREIQAILFVIIFVGLILLLGPVVAVFLFSSGFLSFTGHYPLIKAIWFSALFSVALYLLFAVALQLQLYHGILAPLITP